MTTGEVHILWTEGALPGTKTYIRPVAAVDAAVEAIGINEKPSVEVGGSEDKAFFRFRIPTGKGDPGEPGKSAYQLWLESGHKGSADDFLASMQGESAYQLWLAEGNQGSPSDFLAALRGQSAYQDWLGLGNKGTPADFIKSLEGKSAYQVWLDSGQQGTRYDFLKALEGKSAYQLWLDQGHTGTPDDFLKSLRGAAGMDNYHLWLQAGHVGTIEDFFASLKGEPGDIAGGLSVVAHDDSLSGTGQADNKLGINYVSFHRAAANQPGLIQLSGDLAGSWDAPRVPGLQSLAKQLANVQAESGGLQSQMMILEPEVKQAAAAAKTASSQAATAGTQAKQANDMLQSLKQAQDTYGMLGTVAHDTSMQGAGTKQQPLRVAGLDEMRKQSQLAKDHQDLLDNDGLVGTVATDPTSLQGDGSIGNPLRVIGGKVKINPATTTSLGTIKLAGDLTGTADAPRVNGYAQVQQTMSSMTSQVGREGLLGVVSHDNTTLAGNGTVSNPLRVVGGGGGGPKIVISQTPPTVDDRNVLTIVTSR